MLAFPNEVPRMRRCKSVLYATVLVPLSTGSVFRGKEVSRYENAHKHLSEFDRDFTNGHFDKGKLNAAINDVKNFVDRNTLDAESRDALRNDLRDLRVVRADHDKM
ncbi:MAG: hypothetical protein ABSB15_08710 [Bryobacteraceae bacterium]|jgi:hypothetical protein